MICQLQCDRCRQVFTPRELEIEKLQNLSKLELRMITEDEDSNIIDLCPRCYKQLYNWYNESNN